MPTTNDIMLQRKLLRMYRDLLAEYLQQQKQWNATETPAFLSTGISVIRGHILNIKGTLRGWKVAVPDHPDDEDIDDDVSINVRHQRELLDIHRANLALYLKQQSEYGEGQAPQIVLHSLNWNRNEIQRIKAILRGWNIAVDDLPEEEI